MPIERKLAAVMFTDIVGFINQIMGNSEFNDDAFTATDFNDDVL